MFVPSHKSLSEVSVPYAALLPKIDNSLQRTLKAEGSRLREFLLEDSELSERFSTFRNTILETLYRNPRVDKDGNALSYDEDHVFALVHCYVYGLAESIQKAELHKNGTCQDWRQFAR